MELVVKLGKLAFLGGKLISWRQNPKITVYVDLFQVIKYVNPCGGWWCIDVGRWRMTIKLISKLLIDSHGVRVSCQSNFPISWRKISRKRSPLHLVQYMDRFFFSFSREWMIQKCWKGFMKGRLSVKDGLCQASTLVTILLCLCIRKRKASGK